MRPVTSHSAWVLRHLSNRGTAVALADSSIELSGSIRSNRPDAYKSEVMAPAISRQLGASSGGSFEKTATAIENRR
jgi:hypothetical protein